MTALLTGSTNSHDLTEILPGTLDGKAIMKTLLRKVKDKKDQYTFNFEGNSQVLDHMFATRRLKGAKLDIVHVNVDFPRVDNTVGSDHEPLVARFKLK